MAVTVQSHPLREGYGTDELQLHTAANDQRTSRSDNGCKSMAKIETATIGVVAGCPVNSDQTEGTCARLKSPNSNPNPDDATDKPTVPTPISSRDEGRQCW